MALFLSLKDTENIRTPLASRLLRLSPRFALLSYLSTLARYIYNVYLIAYAYTRVYACRNLIAVSSSGIIENFAGIFHGCALRVVFVISIRLCPLPVLIRRDFCRINVPK